MYIYNIWFIISYTSNIKRRKTTFKSVTYAKKDILPQQDHCLFFFYTVLIFLSFIIFLNSHTLWLI